MARDLDDVAREFARARADSARFKIKLAEAQAKVASLRPEVAEAIAEAVSKGRPLPEVSELTGYTIVRVRQICRAAGVEPDAEAEAEAETPIPVTQPRTPGRKAQPPIPGADPDKVFGPLKRGKPRTGGQSAQRGRGGTPQGPRPPGAR